MLLVCSIALPLMYILPVCSFWGLNISTHADVLCLQHSTRTRKDPGPVHRDITSLGAINFNVSFVPSYLLHPYHSYALPSNAQKENNALVYIHGFTSGTRFLYSTVLV